jgi:ADP-ribose pyrophosphatase
LSNSATDEKSITYLATDLQFHEASPEESEVLQIKKINLDAAYLMMNEGKITDSITVASILKLKLLDISGELNKMLGI